MSPVSGLLGVAWQTLASSGRDLMMSFQLTRCICVFALWRAHNLFAHIPRSAPGTGSWEPIGRVSVAQCKKCPFTQRNMVQQHVTQKISFGGPSWSVSPADFQLAQLSSQCVREFFVLSATSSGNGPRWMVGDTLGMCHALLLVLLRSCHSDCKKRVLCSGIVRLQWVLLSCLRRRLR